MAIWFTSDLHFGHRKICEFTHRGDVVSQDSHDEWVIGIWNKTVAAGDIVYHLGDFSFYKDKNTTLDILRRLNGQKIFVKGNHDRSEAMYEAKRQNLIQWFGDYKEITLGEQKIPCVLFHFPITAWHRQHYGAVHAHGHCHGNLKDDGRAGRRVDVGLDSSYNHFGEHCLFSESQFIDIATSYPIFIAEDHRPNRSGDL